MKRITSFLLLIQILVFTSIFTSCNGKDKKIDLKEINTHKSAMDVYNRIKIVNKMKQDAFDDFVKNMPLEEKICQLFIENLEGNESFKPVEKLKDISGNEKIPEDSYIIPGGYLFFSFNIGNTPEQIINFTDSIHNYCQSNNKNPPFLAVDQEGGYVNRLKKINGPLPSAQNVAENLDYENAGKLYEMQAKQMKLLGFNINLAPVTEICTKDNSDFLAERSFGNQEAVINYGKECINAYEKNSVGTVLKHFPGNTNTDPHTGLPEIKLNKEELFNSLKPFEELIKTSPSGILMSHARTSTIDSETPSCLSYEWVTNVLRNQYHYDGIIFSDDIFMGALASNGYPPEKAVVMAIEAGIDCIMISEKRILKPAKVLYKKAVENKDFEQKIENAVKHIEAYKLQNGLLKLVDDGKGGYKIITVDFENLQNIDRMELFTAEKNRNIQFYENNFKKDK